MLSRGILRCLDKTLVRAWASAEFFQGALASFCLVVAREDRQKKLMNKKARVKKIIKEQEIS